MKSALSTLQTVAKVALIVCKVLFVCSIVGICISAVGIVWLAFGGESVSVADILTFLPPIQEVEGLTTLQLAMAMLPGLIEYIGGTVIVWFAIRYLKNELKAGTPFTTDGAQEIFRLGIINIVASLVVEVISGILQAVTVPTLMEVDMGGTIALGAMFVLMSFIFRHGVEISENKNTDVQE